MREIEAGTFSRDLAKAKRHMASKGTSAVTLEEALAMASRPHEPRPSWPISRRRKKGAPPRPAQGRGKGCSPGSRPRIPGPGRRIHPAGDDRATAPASARAFRG